MISAVPPSFLEDARWLPQAFDVQAMLVRLVAMTPATYRAASFLDDRVLQSASETLFCDWNEIAEKGRLANRRDARWIFHIGHVGSTLVSRLLGELGNVLAVREPRILRDLALSSGQVLGTCAEAVTKLLSRSFAPEQWALVKATSFVSEIAPLLCPPGERSLFLFAAPANYIRSILAGENSRKELAALAKMRAQRCAARVSGLADCHVSEAHLAAAAWACEMTSLEQAADAMADRAICWADFDLMLANMPRALSELATFFGFGATPATIDGIVRGPLMSRYSKALEYDYTPALRRELLEEADRDFRTEIQGAMIMLQRAAERSPLLARALARSQPET